MSKRSTSPASARHNTSPGYQRSLRSALRLLLTLKLADPNYRRVALSFLDAPEASARTLWLHVAVERDV